MIYDIAAAQFFYGWTLSSEASSYKANGAQKAWTIWDGGGEDTLDASAVAGNHIIDLSGGVDDNGKVRFSKIGQERIAIALDPETNWTKAIVIENAKGGSGDDSITGNDAKNELIAGAGKDTLVGGEENDTLVGGPDTSSSDVDKLYGEDGNDLLIDHYQADKSADSLYGGVDNDRLFGGKGDRLYGEAGSDTYWLNSSKADDISNVGTNTFVAYTGNATLDNQITLQSVVGSTVVANTVVDKIYINEGAAAQVNGLGANDEVYWGGTRISGTFYKQASGPYEYVLGNSLHGSMSSGDTFFIYDDHNNRVATLMLSGFNNAAGLWGSAAGISVSWNYGAAGNIGGYTALPDALKPDSFLSAYPDPVAAGTAGNDSIPGSYLADNIQLLGGNDTCDAGTGNDTCNGGDGGNLMSGGPDVDRFNIELASAVYTDTLLDFNPSVGEIIDVTRLGSNLALSITQTGADASFTIGARTVLMKNVNANDNYPPLHGICTVNAR